MRIAWVGGLDRNEGAYEDAARAAGHELEVHSGRVGGNGARALRRAIERADLVVVLTAVNSHGALDVARRTARELGRPLVLERRCGLARFRELCAALPRAA